MKRKKLFMSLTLMCGLLPLAFTFDTKHVEWLWADKEPAALLIGIAAFIFALLWHKSARHLKESNNI